MKKLICLILTLTTIFTIGFTIRAQTTAETINIGTVEDGARGNGWKFSETVCEEWSYTVGVLTVQNGANIVD